MIGRRWLPGFSELEPWASIRKMAFQRAIFVYLIDAHGRIDGNTKIQIIKLVYLLLSKNYMSEGVEAFAECRTLVECRTLGNILNTFRKIFCGLFEKVCTPVDSVGHALSYYVILS